MQTKICTKCKKELPLTEFHKDSRRKDGVYSQCKECKNEYKQLHKEKLLDLQKERRKRNKEDIKAKQKAWNKVYYALKVGKIQKPNVCELCACGGKLQAHHKDYNKPFEITWVCQTCHAKLDNERRSLK